MAAGEHLQQQGGEGPAKKEGAQKRLLFDTIAKYYSGQERAPLLSNRYLEVHAGILGLLGENQGGDGYGGKWTEARDGCRVSFGQQLPAVAHSQLYSLCLHVTTIVVKGPQENLFSILCSPLPLSLACPVHPCPSPSPPTHFPTTPSRLRQDGRGHQGVPAVFTPVGARSQRRAEETPGIHGRSYPAGGLPSAQAGIPPETSGR